MKKRLVSLLLTLSMVFSMMPMLGIGTSASAAYAMDELTAAKSGKDVYLAWSSIYGKNSSVDKYAMQYVDECMEIFYERALEGDIERIKNFSFVLNVASLNWGALGEKTERELFYQTILYDNLIASNIESAGFVYENQDEVYEFLNDAASVIDKADEDIGDIVDLLGEDNLDAFNTIASTFEKAARGASMVDAPRYLKYANIFNSLEDEWGFFDKVYKAGDTLLDFYKKIIAIYSIQDVSEYNKIILEKVYDKSKNLNNLTQPVKNNQTPDGGCYTVEQDEQLKNAIDDVLSQWNDLNIDDVIELLAQEGWTYVTDAEFLESGIKFVAEKALYPTVTKILSNLSSKILNSNSAQLEPLKKWLKKSGGASDILSGVGEAVGGFSAARLGCNIFLDYDDKEGTLYQLASWAKIETLLYAVLSEVKNAFNKNPTEENARLLNAAYKMMLNLKYASYETVKDYYRCWSKKYYDALENNLIIEQNNIKNILSTYEFDASEQYRKIIDIDIDSMTQKKSTITFDAQKGKVSPTSTTFLTGDSVTLPTPSRGIGYNFLGWSKNKNASKGEYEAGKSYTFAEGDITLYAIWKPKLFDVIFEAGDEGYFKNAGSNTITKAKEYNQKFVIDVEKPTPKTDEYEFSGYWEYINPTTGVPTTYIHGNTYFSIGDSTLNAKVLKAVWNNKSAPTPDTPTPAPTYSILYNANVPDGTTVSNLPSAQTKNAGASITLASGKPSRSGYSFLGWHTDSTSSVADSQYAPGSTYSVDANLTLYAIWQQDKTEVPGTGIPGDIDKNTAVNNRDLVAFRKYLDQLKTGVAAAAETSEIDLAALDINGNGKSSEEADFETLFKYLTGWDVDIYYGTGDDIEHYFDVTHEIEGDLLAKDELEVFNGRAKMTWNINSSQTWKAESSVSWIYFDDARTVRKTSGSAGKQTLYIYLSDTQTSSTRTGKVKFTVDDETYTIILRQKKAEFAVSHPDYSDILKEKSIRLYNGSQAKMNWTIKSSHKWDVVLEDASSNWVKAEKINDTTMLLTTLGYASGSTTNTAKVSFNVNGDTYTVEIYQSAMPEPVTELDAPESVLAEAIDHESISVIWYGVKNATEYKVYRSTSRSSGYKCIGTATITEYIDTGLEEDTKYYYKVKACVGDVESEYSGYTYATTEEGIAVSFSVTHSSHGEIVDADAIEVINGKAYMTWTINSSHAWEAETTASWIYFNEARTKSEASGSAGKTTLKVYLDDSQTSSKRTGKVNFTVNGEVYTVKLMQKKAQISISHPNHSNIIKDQPIHLFNNANISMNWTINSTHDWTVSIGTSSSNWISAEKTSNTNLRLTTLWYASGGVTNTATILIYVNGDTYEIDVYQN